MPLQITKNPLMPLNPGTTPPPPGGYVVAARATSEPQNLSGITPMVPDSPAGAIFKLKNTKVLCS